MHSVVLVVFGVAFLGARELFKSQLLQHRNRSFNVNNLEDIMRHFLFYESHINNIITHLLDDVMMTTKAEPLLVHALHSFAEAITWIGLYLILFLI